MVMNGFYMVYSLTGWILSGRDKRNWSLEAEGVGLWVLLGMAIFCALVVAFVYLRGGGRWHPLVISSAHMVVAVLLTLSIFITIRL